MHGPRQEYRGGGRAPGVYAHQDETASDQVQECSASIAPFFTAPVGALKKKILGLD